MKIPDKLKIGGHEYEIVFPYYFTERSDVTGQNDFNGKIIRVADKVDSEFRASSAIAVTFIHEVLHAIDHNSGQRMFEGSDGETKIEALSEGIYQVIVDNGEGIDGFIGRS